MKKIFILTLFIFTFLIIKGQSVSDLKSVTAFIYVQDSLGRKSPNGTCFFVGIRSKQDTTQYYPYLVTAKHVLQKEGEEFHTEIFVRMNTKDSSRFSHVPIDTNSTQRSVYFHSDPSIDIAVIPYLPLENDFIFKFIDTSFIFDRKAFQSLQIHEGLETLFTGLFTAFIGDAKINPIVRFGKIALVSEEKIDWVKGKSDLILVETSSYGGNSGSPIYFKIPIPNSFNGYQLILGGILSGTFRDLAEIKVIENSNIVPIVPYNNGISAITPVYLLREILYSDELSKLRK